MDPLLSMKINASAMQANRLRMDAVSSNIANIETTSTPEGGPYKRKTVVFTPKSMSFQDHLRGTRARGVNAKTISEINAQPILKYDPSHPDADNNGYVAMPNINAMQEMADLQLATKAFEMNATAFKANKRMFLKTLEIGR